VKSPALFKNSKNPPARGTHKKLNKVLDQLCLALKRARERLGDDVLTHCSFREWLERLETELAFLERLVAQLQAIDPDVDPLAVLVAGWNDSDVESEVGDYGPDNAHRLAIQFVYNTCGVLDGGADIPEAFGITWTGLVEETSQPDWRFSAVANLSNFSYDGDVVDLGCGVSIQGRSFEWLMQTLKWDRVDCDRLAEDWAASGSASSYVLVVETSLPKAPDNFILSSDGAAYPLAVRALLAMRLHGAGDVNIGQIFLNRPAAFNVGIGGRGSTGWTIRRPGLQYKLTTTMIPKICKQVKTLVNVEDQLNTKAARHIGIAIRSFSSIYDRLMHQAAPSYRKGRCREASAFSRSIASSGNDFDRRVTSLVGKLGRSRAALSSPGGHPDSNKPGCS